MDCTRATADLLPAVKPIMQRLMPPGCRVLVATSGGPDSQALLDLMARLRGELEWAQLFACGINHGLRPTAAAELQLAAQLAAQHGIAFTAITVQVAPRGNKLAAARRSRYRALCAEAQRCGADFIAVAHTATDQVETILYRLARGTGGRGASAMAWQRGCLVRPLLGTDRPAIMAYVHSRAIPFALDPSNADPRRTRAQLRAHVLPTLGQINTGFARNFVRFADLSRADEAYLERCAQRHLRARWGVDGSLDTAAWQKLAGVIAARVLRAWLRRHGIIATARQLECLSASLSAGRGAMSIMGQQVVLARGRLWRVGARGAYDVALAAPGSLELAPLGVTITSRVEPAPTPHDIGNFAAETRHAVAFDGDRLHLGLRVRSWQRGDTFAPFGLNGHMKVGDLFTDLKIAHPLRATWPLVTHGTDVLWVVGLRRAATAPITPATRTILSLHALGARFSVAC